VLRWPAVLYSLAAAGAAVYFGAAWPTDALVGLALGYLAAQTAAFVVAQRWPWHSADAPPAPPTAPAASLTAVRRARWRTVALSVVAVAALGLILLRAEDLLEGLSGTEPDLGYVLPIVGLATGYYVLKALRWHYYLRLSDVRLPWWRTSAAYLAGQWFTFTPAGELVRGYMLRERYGVPLERSTPTIVLQALMDFASLAVVGVLVLPLLPALAPVSLPVSLPVIAAVGALALPAPRRWLRSSAFIARTPLGRSQRFHTILDHADLLLAPQALLAGLALGTLAVLFGAASLLLAGMALRVEGWRASEAVVTYTVAQLLGGLSVLPQGLGVTEASGTALLALMDVPSWQAAAAVLLFRLCTLGWSVLLGGGALLLLRLDRPQAIKVGEGP
jgi:uncharacterized membrane protein YbhN (UPF0104 family)